METKFGLPKEISFCKKCVMSNQKPNSTPEFTHKIDAKHQTLAFDSEGVCDACRYSENKENIDWNQREKQLLKLLDQYRRNDGEYDCVVPGSGGKDSAIAAHILKYKYGMHPLTVTWPPLIYTDYGYQNFRNWIEIGGFDNITFKPNGHAMRLLTKLSIENLLHPFQTFILGQKNLAPKIAAKFGIPLIFYGENEAEYGNPITDNNTSLRNKSYYSMKKWDKMILAGVPVKQLVEHYKLHPTDLMTFLPARHDDIKKNNLQVHYLGYYMKWTPQENYYYAVENTGFHARPFRSQGTYSKYSSIDDKMDDLHYYTTFIKFGIGRATYDASQEIRNKHLTREEGVALVHKYDGEFPDKYFKEIMEYIDMKEDDFMSLCDEFRSPHLWNKENGKWKLRKQVS